MRLEAHGSKRLYCLTKNGLHELSYLHLDSLEEDFSLSMEMRPVVWSGACYRA